ncbi:MAG: AAA family ATPase [Candidatus Cloacimonetes bacterium]|nr:AAA family ATPase [Candidatus Cloacimonadota bacterium]
MKATINNFRGIESAEFDLKPITIIKGDNGSGKTSIAQAIASALTGECPISDMKKQDYKYLVNNGTPSAVSTVETKNGLARINFPEGKGWTERKAPHSSVYATGITSPVDMTKKDSADAWVKILKTEPTLDDLKQSLDNDKHTDEVIALVKMRGWDGAYDQIKTDATKYKGRWEKITGERYGTSKAETWIAPPTKDKKTLETAVTEAQQKYNETLKKSAINEHEHNRLKELSEQTETHKVSLQRISKTKDETKTLVDKLRAEIDKVAQQKLVLKCPHCDKPVNFIENKLVPVGEQPIVAENVSALQSEYQKAFEVYQKLLKDEGELHSLISQCEGATQQLEQSIVKENDDTALINLQKAQQELTAFQNYHDALSEHAEVIWRIEVQKILAPEGLRKRKTDDKITELNKSLSALCKVARWGCVAIDTDYNVSYDNRIFAILSESEQYRVRCTLQSAISKLDGSDVLIFDRADLLTKSGRDGLYYLCKYIERYCLILLSVSNKSDKPNINSNDEITYWLENGQIVGDGIATHNSGEFGSNPDTLDYINVTQS